MRHRTCGYIVLTEASYSSRPLTLGVNDEGVEQLFHGRPATVFPSLRAARKAISATVPAWNAVKETTNDDKWYTADDFRVLRVGYAVPRPAPKRKGGPRG